MNPIWAVLCLTFAAGILMGAGGGLRLAISGVLVVGIVTFVQYALHLAEDAIADADARRRCPVHELDEDGL